MKLFSPAKLNLFLRVLGRRDDGYHNIASLFQAIDLGDSLTFHLSHRDKLICNDPSVPCNGSNLVFKAAELFRHRTGHTFGLEVHLEKNIPIQAGLGGGSSNGATTLWALNELHDRPVSESILMTWAAELGSDVAFFFSTGTAYCRGRGERVQNLPPLSQSKPLWILKPPGGLSTKRMYQQLDLDQTAKPDPQILLESFLSGSPEYHNDFESAAFKEKPSLAHLKEQLLAHGCETVSMTGSGIGFFCFGEPPKQSVPTYSAHFVQRPPQRWYSSPIIESEC